MITINIDSRAAVARFSPSGIPEAVRRNLRMTIPDQLKVVGREVDANLAALKSRKNLDTKMEMIENARGITGQLQVVWTGDQSRAMVPQVLETGARPHVIEAVAAKALAFEWPIFGGMAFFKRVQHPGFPGIRYLERAWNATKAGVKDALEQAVNQGLRE